MTVKRFDEVLSDIQEEQRHKLAHYDEAIQLLQPFANFAKKFNAKPLGGIGDHLYGIHTGTEWEANLHLSDMNAVLAFIERIGGKDSEIDEY